MLSPEKTVKRENVVFKSPRAVREREREREGERERERGREREREREREKLEKMYTRHSRHIVVFKIIGMQNAWVR